MHNWFHRQWQDIKGNVKFALVMAALTAAMGAVVVLTHGLLWWQQGGLAAIFSIVLIWAASATYMATRKPYAETTVSDRLPLPIQDNIKSTDVAGQKTNSTTSAAPATQGRQAKALSTLQGMMRAAAHIRDRAFPAAAEPSKCFDFIKVVYKIHKDFSSDVCWEYQIRASDQPVHFWTTRHRASAHATPVDYLLDINFRVHGDEQGQLVYLPVVNDPLEKQVVIYFLPRIEPGLTRKIKVTYTWPGLFKQLDVNEQEDFGFTCESKEKIRHMEYHLYLEPGTGRRLFCEVSGPDHPGARLQKAAEAELQWPGYVYTVENAPAVTARFSLIVRLKA